MDFIKIRERSLKKGVLEIYPSFQVCRSKDLMVRGKAFYAIWDPERGLWSTDEYDVQRLVDKDIWEYKEKMHTGDSVTVHTMLDFSSNSWSTYKRFLRDMSDNSVQLDEKLTFANTEVKKKDYVSRRLSYSLEDGDYSAWDELVGTLYSEDERAKIEWSIGSVVSGDSRNIQKFLVLYGEAGAGKSTILNIIQKLFEGYYVTFDAKALTNSNNSFSTEVFRSNPLVAIQHDGDLSRIEDNTKLNSIVSHEIMTMNEKYKSSYMARANAFLFMATNRPVKITDAKSGVIRRLIDVKPSGNRIPAKRYQALMSQIDFQLGAIAKHCLDVYHDMGKDFYNTYVPFEMIFQTDVFFNFVEANYDIFAEQDGVTLNQAYTMYKAYCDESLVDYKLARHKFREELKSYFREFQDIARLNGKQVRSYYSGFLKEKFELQKPEKEEKPSKFILDSTKSLLDDYLADYPAQYATEDDKPVCKWVDVKTKLSDIDTTKVHYVKVPENMIVIDFDLKDDSGEKSYERNAEAASKWPPTYAEYSKSGKGIHLHYIYEGDVSRLKTEYSKGIEVKVYRGNSSLRRRLTLCNTIPISSIASGLPEKEEKATVNIDCVKSEKKLRELIERNLRKEIHPGTKPSVDFIKKILDDAYESGMKYDVSDMRQKILLFAMNSTNQSDYCIKLVGKMKYKSEEANPGISVENGDLVFYDVEVFPNLFLVNWKVAGENASVVRMINPSASEIESLMKMKLVGFNCRRYDNHILYGRYIGYTNEQLYNLSQKIVNGEAGSLFGEAYNISYTDVYDFSSKKQSLKKFEIELGIHHQELGLPWDQPVPEELWPKVAEYCDNDVIATEAVFNARKADWTARKILASVAGMTVNDTTNSLTTRIIFGNDRKPQSQFNYRFMGDFHEEAEHTYIDGTDQEYVVFENGKPIFSGYTFDRGKSIYRGEEVGEGGYVYAEPGIYYDVALLDISSMHPSSIVAEELFGPVYTRRFQDILEARIAIKHGEFDKARTMLEGKLAPYLEDESSASDLAQALKIAINSVYGLTSAKFDNPFRDLRNKDNIVAKRGALFMINLKHEVQKRGFTVAHIKTDSIKIPKATPEIINFVMEFGRAYGYNFEHEATYERMCLVNDAVYIAKYKGGKHDGEWTATGAEFQHPYIFKTLFSHEPIEFEDMCETKSVSTAIYLDMNEKLPDVSLQEKQRDDCLKALKDSPDMFETERSEILDNIERLSKIIEQGHCYQYIGKVGLFCPIKSGENGGILLREKDGKFYSVGGSKGYRWLESEFVKISGKIDSIDQSYYEEQVREARKHISEFGNFEKFVNGGFENDEPPFFVVPCGDNKKNSCIECSNYIDGKCSCGYDTTNYVFEKE